MPARPCRSGWRARLPGGPSWGGISPLRRFASARRGWDRLWAPGAPGVCPASPACASRASWGLGVAPPPPWSPLAGSARPQAAQRGGARPAAVCVCVKAAFQSWSFDQAPRVLLTAVGHVCVHRRVCVHLLWEGAQAVIQDHHLEGLIKQCCAISQNPTLVFWDLTGPMYTPRCVQIQGNLLAHGQCCNLCSPGIKLSLAFGFRRCQIGDPRPPP